MNRRSIWVPAHQRRKPSRPEEFYAVISQLSEAKRRDEFLEHLPEQIEAELEREFYVVEKMGS